MINLKFDILRFWWHAHLHFSILSKKYLNILVHVFLTLYPMFGYARRIFSQNIPIATWMATEIKITDPPRGGNQTRNQNKKKIEPLTSYTYYIFSYRVRNIILFTSANNIKNRRSKTITLKIIYQVIIYKWVYAFSH